jgi:hypothetical protein
MQQSNILDIFWGRFRFFKKHSHGKKQLLPSPEAVTKQIVEVGSLVNSGEEINVVPLVPWHNGV